MTIHPAAKLIKDVVMEGTGLSSLDRIYTDDIRPYVKRGRAKYKRSRAKMAAARRKKSLSARMAPSAAQSTRQYGEITQGNAQPVTQRTLLVDEIPFPPQGGNVGNRLGTTIRVSGIRLCERWINRGLKPVTLHMAILQPKAPVENPATFDWTSQFFRSTIEADPAEGTTRTENFLNASDVNNTYEFLYDCYPINPDKFNILMHKRVILNPRDLLEDTAGADTSQIRSRNTQDYIWNLDTYLPLKGKRLTFNDKTDVTPNQPLVRVFWHQATDSDEWNPQTPVPGANPAIKNQLHRMRKSVVYFKNGLN